MYYRLTHIKTRVQSKWIRIQRIQYWRICDQYSKTYIVEGRGETRSPSQQEQWINYRALGAITRVKLELRELISHKQAPLFTEFERKAIYRFLNTLEANIRNQPHQKKRNSKCQR